MSEEKAKKVEPEMTPEEQRFAAMAKKLLASATDEAGIAKAIRFRNDLIAARKTISRFNEALAVYREFRGADWALGLEKIVLRDPNSSTPGRPALSEEEKLKKILG